MQPQADTGMDDLVPVRLRLLLGERHVVDTFLWNKRDGVEEMQRFSEGFCADTCTPLSLAPVLTEEIKRQVEAWEGRVAAQQPSGPPLEGERLEVIRLDFAVGVTRFTDQFLWDINDPAASPELFAHQLSRDLGLEPPIAIEVACKLREQLAQLRRQQHKRGPPVLVSAAPVSEEPPGKARPGSRRSRSGAQDQSDAGVGHTMLRSVQHTRCVRLPEQWEEWGPEVRVMSSHEALQYSMEAAQRAAEAEAAANAAKGRPAVAPPEQDRQAEATLSPASTAEGELPSVRKLRPRRTARLTELMMAMESPRAGGASAQSLSAGGPSRSIDDPGGGGGNGGGGGALAAGAAADLGAAGMAPALTAVSGGHSQSLLPPHLNARHQQMLLHRRQLMLQDAAASGGAPLLEQEFSGTLSAGYSTLLRQQQDSALFISQHLPSPLLRSHQAPGQQQQPQLPSASLPDAFEPFGPPAHRHQQLPPELRSVAGAAGGGLGGLLDGLGTGSQALPPLLPPLQQQQGGGQLGGGPGQPRQSQQPQQAGRAGLPKKSPYADLFGEMFEDAPSGGGLPLDGPESGGLLGQGAAGPTGLLGLRGSGQPALGSGHGSLGLSLDGSGSGVHPQMQHVPGSEVDLLQGIAPPSMFF